MKNEIDFLYEAAEDEIEILSEIIRNKGGVNCSLKSRDKYENKNKYIKATVDELLKYGSYTFGREKEYIEILKDVCKKMKVKYDNDDEMGKNLLLEVFGMIYKDLSDEKKIEINNGIFGDGNYRKKYYEEGGFFSFENIFKNADIHLLYILASTIAGSVAMSMIGRGLSLASSVFFSRALSILSGPLAAIMAVWTIKELAGPAYRVTIPAVIYIESIRIMEEVREISGKTYVDSINGSDKNDGVIYL